MANDLRKDFYNEFSQYPIFAYNCIAYLINDANDENLELLWRLLYYNDNNAWKEDSDHPNLTVDQKRALIYNGEQDPQNYRVFMDTGMDNAIEDEICLIRISPFEIVPIQQGIGSVSMAFEVYCHYKINTLSNHQTRIDTITQLMIGALNGEPIEGVGRLYFNSRASRQCRSVPIGQIPFRGRRTIMCNWTA